MEPLLDLLGKFLGAQWLWNLATLALLLQAYKAFSKLQKLPEDAIARKEFAAFEKAVDARFSTYEGILTGTTSRVHTLWKRSGISDPFVRRVEEGQAAFNERMEIVEPDPWPRRRATDRALLTPPFGTDVRGDRTSDPGRRSPVAPPIPREDPSHPPSDRPFDGDDPRDRSPFDVDGDDSDRGPAVRPKRKR